MKNEKSIKEQEAKRRMNESWILRPNVLTWNGEKRTKNIICEYSRQPLVSAVSHDVIFWVVFASEQDSITVKRIWRCTAVFLTSEMPR